ncbi:hypothetical protein Achl_4222 (plasmid) [Pseudarthrobacter chlorophenolicus A6]|uniref:Uncharacterized protein n=1 Tax=Pseudarthrobacter chlorophenolicus (strain ATCC 700700 / DSM 12829 / CIP 107037 / JCM 12360 / KCTC 9906 / NCIMB 13794 / A6) TaxID=452863 RepID=B8HIC6_PSECP|nr:hypothetical protein [Pseudarthrobacter chlorophenolicus]ACL42173.1 hypothetical protein Achl_4222 [Pseudarthrobacter chlorophenolicus A6]SDQ14405.1 hypothetical protein SAMN04489738_0280 [Pseudarthrobacter chlorophenolicus]
MENLTNRVPAGVANGGQFAPAPHSEPALSLIPAPADGPDFDYAFEADRGPGLRKELEALPKISVRSAINASHVSDLIRNSYSVYFTNGEAPYGRADAVRFLDDALRHLPRDQREKQIELIRFAVHEEMKHWADSGHVLNPEHKYELLIEESDYSDEDDLLENGQEENRERWELLANTAAFYAVAADNSSSVRQAAVA